MKPSKYEMRAISAAALAALAAGFLSGCGGSTLNGSPLAATPDSSPVIYGLNAQAATSGSYLETSGLGYTDATSGLTSVITGATAYQTTGGPGPLPLYQSAFAAGIPLGFAPDGAFVVGAGSALPTNYAGNLTFRAYISTGAKNNNRVDLVTSSVILTSSDDPSFSQPLTFDSAGIGNGPLGQGQYAATFPVPAAFKATGLHNLHTVVADVDAQSSATDFDFVAVAPTDAAVLTPFLGTTVPDGQPAKTTASVNTIAATITNAVTGARTRVVLDDTNTLILFAAPGSQTVTVTANVTLTHPDGTTQTVTQTGTETDTLVAGQAFVGAGVTVAGETPAAAATSTRPRFHKKSTLH